MVSLVRKRASALTELLGRELRARGREIVIERLHVHLPRVLKTPATQAGQENVR
ncbi:hypothetical protein ABZ891_18070 [Streptomyces sp. NPDC047023]|uniref:hypothetical protein n=1 Tax=Streptomyces sp. NPDC047023 TaxID=3155139 RepID=UPI0033F821C7